MKKLYILIISLIVIVLPSEAFSQKLTIQGTITDQNKEALIGASVIIEGTNTGVIADLSGNYKITVDKGAKLSFAFLGYETQIKTIENDKTLNITLATEDKTLDEIVVVGYGTVLRSDLTGSVSSLGEEVFSEGTGASLTEMLSGRVAGMQVITNSGVPGGESTIRIRGSNSMGDSEPLYIIDGVHYDNTAIDGFEEEGSSISPLSMINPTDIMSMEILKDASATAIYGSRGSNGVIIITTRSGEAGRARVNFDIDYGISNLTKRIDLLNSSQLAILKNEASLLNGGTGSGTSASLALAELNSTPSDDWQDILYQTGHSINASASISGGTEKIKYMVSFNAYSSEGIVPKTDFNRLTGRVNLDYSVNDRLKFGTRITLSEIETSGLPTSSSLGASAGTTSVITRALRTKPTVVPNYNYSTYDPDNPYGLEDEDYTPLMAIYGITQENIASQYLANVYGEYIIIDGLTWKSTANISERKTESNYYQSRIMPSGYDVGGRAKLKSSSSSSFTQENTLSYNKRFNRNHRVNIVVGNTYSSSSSSSKSITGEGFPNDDFTWTDISSATSIDASNSETSSLLLSYFGRANYTLKSKYTFTLTGRADGTSKYADGNKWGFFPAAAFAWRIDQEPWMRDYKTTISNFKLRASYGLTGNSSVSSYSSITLMNSGNVIFGGSTSDDSQYISYQTSSALANSGLKWETTYQANFGIDLSLFKSRVEFSLDLYQKDTKDLLVGAEIGAVTGYSTMTLNFGEMRNRGLEFSALARIYDKKDFSWTISGNIGFNKTIITDLMSDYFASGVSMPWNGIDTQILIEGEELGIFWGLQRDGIFKEGDDALMVSGVYISEGDQKYVDQDGNGIIDDNDKTIIGRAQADFTYGINTSITYKNFDLTINIDGSYGGEICNMNAIQGLMYGTAQQFESVWYNRWTPDNPSDTYPKLSNTGSLSSYNFSDLIIEDGSYIRLQSITLGYKVPLKAVNRMKISTIRTYVSVQNILTITNYTGYSPVVSYGGKNSLRMGHDYGAYPNPFTVKVGLNLGF